MLDDNKKFHSLTSDGKNIWYITIKGSADEVGHTFEVLANDEHSVMSLFHLIEKLLLEDNQKKFWDQIKYDNY